MIYTSTSCLKNPRILSKVLDVYQKGDIENVELGSVHTSFNINILKKYDFNFLIHNYFPPSKKPFIFNLASQNPKIHSNSIQLAKSAIDLCRKIDSPLYTFHAGFTIDPQTLGKAFSKKNISSRSKALTTFIDSVQILVDFSKTHGIKIAIEPNVVQKFNLVKNRNDLLLLAEYDEIELFFKFFKKSDIGILLDLGHTAVTSNWLNFDKDDFVLKCKDRVSAIHVSNNDGKHDQHRSLTKNCWQSSKLKLFKKQPIILETMNLTIDQIKENIDIAKSSQK
jgi:sugar phosphate isomerase/epimerase